MNKPILIALLVVLLAGGGIAFAQSEAVSELLGLKVTTEIEGEDEGQNFGEEVSDAAQNMDQKMDPDEIIPEVANVAREKSGELEKSEEDNRSPVADAVLEVLGRGSSPGDASFGENVSKQAQEDGRALGEAVSNAARGANGSAGKGAGN